MAEETEKVKCQCSKTWVLVVHNDFLQIEGYERHGNDVDLENLRRVFQFERRCKFAELKNCDKEKILGTLSSEQNLIEMFHPDDDYDEKTSTPELIYLFVLSHGESGGRIMTDHLKIEPSKPSHFELALESYNKSDIWNKLANLDLLKMCTKIIFFAPCRGINAETKIDPNDEGNFIKQDIDKITLPGWLTSKPNREDFIIFYATVESTYANRNELQGTWFVQSICSVLDEVSKDLDILMFFTRVQLQVCQMTKIGRADVGQTPQLHFFSKNKVEVCARHCEMKCRTKNVQLKTKNVDLSDCRQTSYHDDLVDEQSVAKGFNLQNLLGIERALFYDWGQQHFNFSRGRAFIFHDDQNLSYTLELASCFKGLDYNVKFSVVKNIKRFTSPKRLKRQFVSDGSLVVCILAQLVETDEGLALLNGGDCILLSAIVDEFSVTNCKHLIGKPKLFFFLDEGNKQDSIASSQITLIDAHQFTNSHAGISIFIGVGAALIEGLCLILNSEELRSGSKSLQAALVDLIRSTDSMPPDRMCIIKPQIISTLPLLVDFPALKPVMAKKKKFYTLSGSFFLALLLTVVFASIFWSHSSSGEKNMADLLDVDLQSNCSINFLPKNTSTVEAFSIGRKKWDFYYRKCKQDWNVFKPENAIADLIAAGNVSQAVSKFKDASKEERSAAQQLKLVVLFAYDELYLSNLGKFCFELSKLFMGEQCFYDVYKRIPKICGLAHIEVLGFWYYYIQRHRLPLSALQYHNNTNLDTYKWQEICTGAASYYLQPQGKCSIADQYELPINSSYTFQKIFALISYEYTAQRFKFFDQFLKLDEEIKKFYLPIVVSSYYYKGVNLNYLLKVLPFHKVGFLACCAINELLMRLKSDGKLNSMEGLILRAANQKLLENGNAAAVNNNEKIMCENVSQELMKYSTAHRNIFLAMFDAGKIFNLANHNLTHYFIMDIVCLRYSKGNLTQLTKLLWRNANKPLKPLKFGCESSVYLVEAMRQHPDHIVPWRRCSWQTKCLNLQNLCGGDLMCRFGFKGYPKLEQEAKRCKKIFEPVRVVQFGRGHRRAR